MTSAVVAALLSLASVLPQDVELAGQRLQRPLPAAYYERIRARPDFFTFAHGWQAKAARDRAAGLATAGTLPVVLVQALFQDSPDPTITPAEVRQWIFEGPTPNGTVPGLYQEMSRGRLHVAGTVLPWVRTQLTLHDVVGASLGLGADSRLGEFLEQALEAVDATTDLGAFDNDGPDGVANSGDDDGVVDAAVFQYPEIGAHCGGAGPWPHKSRLTNVLGRPFTTNDARPSGDSIMVDDYVIQSAVSCGGDSLASIAVMSHELGHTLGLPDLYDASLGSLPEQRLWLIGCWSLMSGGGWGCGDGGARTTVPRPPHMGPWEKGTLGWLDRVDSVGVVLDTDVVLHPVQESGSVLKVPLTTREYLLLEFRRPTGFDADLPLPGVLIYHVDLDRPFQRCQGCPRLFRVALVEGDGNGALLRSALEGGNRGEPGDVFGAAGVQRLTNATQPSSRLNTNAPSTVAFHGIVIEDSIARVRLSTAELALQRLLERFLSNGAVTLTGGEQDYLDRFGNGNGQYDLGDLRIYLREHPGVATRR